jgi:hypothetical protein
MYDVLVPDAPQKDADFEAAISNYPVAILVGEYRPSPELARRLTAYVRGGGTLYLNSAHLDLGFTKEVVGVGVTGRTFTFSGSFYGCDGAEHPTDGEYDCDELAPGSDAKVFVRDGKGRPLAVVHRCGMGRVVTAAPRWLVPRFTADGNAIVHYTRTGRRRFPFMEYFLDGLQKRFFPVKVDGSAQFGLNRTANGWWLWCLNNSGIRKFADVPQEIDRSFDSRLSIDVSRLGANSCRELIGGKSVSIRADGTFGWELPAGELAVFELR